LNYSFLKSENVILKSLPITNSSIFAAGDFIWATLYLATLLVTYLLMLLLLLLTYVVSKIGFFPGGVSKFRVVNKFGCLLSFIVIKKSKNFLYHTQNGNTNLLEDGVQVSLVSCVKCLWPLYAAFASDVRVLSRT